MRRTCKAAATTVAVSLRGTRISKKLTSRENQSDVFSHAFIKVRSVRSLRQQRDQIKMCYHRKQRRPSHVLMFVSGVAHWGSLLRVQKCCKTTANTNNLCRNSIASGYDLQSLDFLGSCQQQVPFSESLLHLFLYLPNWNSICFNGSSN